MKPKVFILFDTHIVSGPIKALFQFLRHADRSRFDFLLGAIEYHKPATRAYIDAVNERDLPLALLRQRFRGDLRPIFDAVRIMRKEEISIIESHGYKTHVIAAIVKLVTGARWIAFSHGWTAENAKVKLYHALDRIMLRFADLNVTVAPDMRDTVVKIVGAGAPVEMILNAIELAAPPSPTDRERVRGEFKVAPETVLLGCFGRMSTEKGQGILLDAIARMKAVSRVEVLLVGDGVDFRIVQEKTAALGLKDRVHFAGYQKNITPYYAAIDALVLPSLSEGTPNVMLEAMACGVPVVSSNVGAVREAITDNETGWLVPPGDPAPLAAALMRAADDSAARARVAAAAKKALYPKFDPKARADKIISLYEQVGTHRK